MFKKRQETLKLHRAKEYQEELDKSYISIKKAELDRLVKNRGSKNRGARYERIKQNKKHNFNSTEEAFYTEWLKESKHLRTLVSPTDSNMKMKITNRDRMIAASIVQWLGTNCGMGFLHKVLGDCGQEIVKKNTTVKTSMIASKYGL